MKKGNLFLILILGLAQRLSADEVPNQTPAPLADQQPLLEQPTATDQSHSTSIIVTKEAESFIQARDLKLEHTDLKTRVLRAAKAGKPFNLNRKDVRKLMLELKHANPGVYQSAKNMNFTQRRQLFIKPILEALGLSDLSSQISPLASTLIGVGTIAGGLGVGAMAGRISQSNTIKELTHEKNKVEGALMMVRTQAENNRSKLEFKIGELETQISDLNETSESGVNLLNLWVDSHVLI
jgi:hypothetical protein